MNLADVDPQFTVACNQQTLQEEKKGFFQSLVDSALTNTKVEKWISEKLKRKIPSIDLIIEFTKEKEMLTKLLEIFTVKPMYRKKNLEKSIQARESAIKLMESGNHKNALILCNQSVVLSPIDDLNENIKAGSQIVLALWLRSECLMKLDKYQLALADLQTAVKICDSADKKGPIFYRQGECYKNLNELARAKISFNLALKCLKKSSPFYQSTENELHELQEGNVPTKSNKEDKKVEILEEKKIEPSDYLDVAQQESMGRYFIAKKDLHVGDKILMKKPYAACLKFNAYGSNCYQCFKRLEVSYGCPECANVAFCSSTCRDVAINSYHKYECHFMDLFIGSGMSVLCFVALRMVTQAGLSKAITAYDIYCKNMNKNNSENISLENEDDLIFYLCSHTELRDPMDYLKRLLMAFFLLRCLQQTNFFNKSDENLSEDKLKVVILLFHYIQILQFNAHEIDETLYSTEIKDNPIKTRSIGVGIYPTVSLFNHDCYSGVVRYFEGNNIIIKIIRPIKVGSIVPENYGPNFARHSKYDRQRMLRSRYWFKCQCNSCEENWIDMGKMKLNVMPKLRCSQDTCDGQIDTTIIDCESVCEKCYKEIEIEFLRMKSEQIKTCILQYEEAKQLMEQTKYTEAIDLYAKALDIFHSIAYPPHYETHIAEKYLRMCILAEKNEDLMRFSHNCEC